MTRQDKFLIAVAAVCALALVANWIRSYSLEEYAGFIGTITATFAGVVVAAFLSVRQFYFQARQQEKKQSQQLAQSLAGELFTVLDILSAGPNVHFVDPTGADDPIPVIFAQLEPTATEEAIRVGLSGPQGSANLSQLSSLMRDYTTISASLYSLTYGTHWTPAISLRAYRSATEISRVRANIIIFCTTVLHFLAAQGIEMPPDPGFRTDPRRVVQYRNRPPT